MAYKQYRTASTEIDLDYMQECEYCKHIAPVPSRIYTEHTLERYVSLFTGGSPISAKEAAESDEASKQAAIQHLPHHVQWQRCTKCGRYGTKAIEMMRKAYPGFKRWRTLNKWIVWSFAFLPLLLFLGGIEAIIRGHSSDGFEMMFYTGPLLAIIWFAGWLVTYNISDSFAKRLSVVNRPEVIASWLDQWNRHGQAAVEEFYNCKRLEDRYMAYYLLQSLRTKLDPIKLEWAIMTKMPYRQIIMRRLRCEYER